jgi:diphosphomevalonate decarboxylase
VALVKYMGKVDSERNLPANGSVSVTLSGLKTVTELRELGGAIGAARELVWDADDPMPEGVKGHLFTPDLPRLTRHLERVKEKAPAIFFRHAINVREPATRIGIRTGNTFPASSGIASSASGFAALTLATAALLAEDMAELKTAWAVSPDLRAAIAELSREGSGSSCRSFEGPFVSWEGERIRGVPADALPPLTHFVLVVSGQPKAVASSEAHERIKTSPLWKGRPERANERFLALRSAIGRGNLREMATLSWQESWEMHSLFHTSTPSFSYWEPATMRALKFLAPFIEGENPPIVTLDAGPNVHVLVRSADRDLWRTRFAEGVPEARVLEDQPGRGASF